MKDNKISKYFSKYQARKTLFQDQRDQTHIDPKKFYFLIKLNNQYIIKTSMIL
ncbi:hypothetical protein CLERM_532 [Coxiella-like endosymbiont]|nr:hypothetical protein CLERM_532 [Coxiella-like endosymbiont]